MAAAIIEDKSQGTVLLQQIREAQQWATGDEWNATVESAHTGDKLFVICDGMVCNLCNGTAVTLLVLDDNVLCSDLLTKHHDSPMTGHLLLHHMMCALAKVYWQKGIYHDV